MVQSKIAMETVFLSNRVNLVNQFSVSQRQKASPLRFGLVVPIAATILIEIQVDEWL